MSGQNSTNNKHNRQFCGKHVKTDFLAPAVSVGETEGAMDSASVFLASSFAYNFVRK